MTLAEKIKYVKNNYGVTYKFISNKCGINNSHLCKFMLPKDNKQHRNLSDDKLKNLDNYLNTFSYGN